MNIRKLTPLENKFRSVEKYTIYFIKLGVN
jgi:hypothetical protein